MMAEVYRYDHSKGKDKVVKLRKVSREPQRRTESGTVRRQTCSECEGTGKGPWAVDDCVRCLGTGKEKVVKYE